MFTGNIMKKRTVSSQYREEQSVPPAAKKAFLAVVPSDMALDDPPRKDCLDAVPQGHETKTQLTAGADFASTDRIYALDDEWENLLILDYPDFMLG